MITFFSGPDSYRREKEFKEEIERFREKSPGIIFQIFDFGECRGKEELAEKFGDLEEWSRGRPLFGNEKAAALKNVFDEEIKDLKVFLKGCLLRKDFYVFISDSESGGKDFAFLKGKSVSHTEFKKLDGEDFKEFIKEEAREAGVKLSSLALSALARVYAGDSWGARTELQKSAFCPAAHRGEPLEIKDFDAVLSFREFPNIFLFINGVQRSSGISFKIKALEGIFLSNEEPAKIFNILAAGKFMSGELILRLANYDVAVKSGKLEYEEVLVDLALTG